MLKADKVCFNFHYKKIAIVGFLLLWTFHILLLYALPEPVLVVSMVFFAILYSKMDWHNAAMFVISISMATMMTIAVLKVTGLNHSIYYRPQEMFSLYDIARNSYHYEENIDFEMTIMHGDLKAFDKNIPSEPRHVLFQTDSYGFRNTKDFHGQKYIMVGDSFVAGNGISQRDLITEQLQRYKVDSYNLAYPGRLNDYIKYIKNFEQTYGKQHEFIVFLYEGNDFGSHETLHVLQHTNVEKIEQYFTIQLDRYRKTLGIGNTDIYRFMHTYIQRILYRKVDDVEKVETRMVGGLPVAFYKPYISITKRKGSPHFLHFRELLEPMQGNITHIFFIPTKYRVYYKHLRRLNPCDPEVLSNRQWDYIQRLGVKLGIRTTNLTQALVEASDTLLLNNRLTYWKGDTHWNKDGIAAAVKVVARQLNEER